MLFVEQMLAHTPPWVWLILAWLIWRGVAMTKPRSVPPLRFFITPVLFLGLGVFSLVERPGLRTEAYVAWAVAALLALGPGSLTAPRGLRYDPVARRIHVPGSIWPLVRLVSVFVLQYASFVAIAVAPEDRHDVRMLALAVSGANAGFFAGYGLGAALRMRRGEQAEQLVA